MANPYMPMDIPAAVPLGAGLAAGGAAGLGGDGKAPSSSDPQYAQFGAATDYDQNTYNQYNQYNQYYQVRWQGGLHARRRSCVHMQAGRP